MPQVTFEMKADEARVVQAFLNVQRAEGKAVEGFKAIKKEADAADKVMAKLGSTAKSMMSGLLASAAAVVGFQQIRREIEAIIQLQERAARQQVTVSAARQEVIRNMVGSSDAAIRGVLKSSSGIAAETNVGESTILMAMAQALSASGGNAAVSVNAVRGAAKFLPERPNDIPEFAGTLLDLRRATGFQDAESNLGLLQFIGAQSRVTDPGKLARSAPEALIGVKAMGGTFQEGAALFSAITTGSADVEGRKSATATISLATQLRDFFQKQGRKGTTGELISALQANPAMGRAFMDSASFEKQALGPIEQLLLNPSSDMAASYAQFERQIPTDPAVLRKVTTESLRQRGLDPLEFVAGTERAFGSASERLLTGDPLAGLGGVTRGGLMKVLADGGMGDLAGKFAGVEFEARTGAGSMKVTDAAITMLRREEQDRRTPRYEESPGLGGFGGAPFAVDPSNESIRQADIIRDLIGQLENTKKLAEAVEKMNNAAADLKTAAAALSKKAVDHNNPAQRGR